MTKQERKKTKLRYILKSKSGNMVPLALALVLVLLLLFCVISEYMRIKIITTGIQDATQSSVIATVNDNYDDVYHSVREGYSGAYTPDGGEFSMSLDYGDIYYRLDKLLGLKRSSGKHTSYFSDGTVEYSITGLTVEIKNAPLAPSDPRNARRFIATATINLEVPVRLGAELLPPLQLTLKVQAGYIEKF